MVGEARAFATLVKRQNAAIQITHCCFHREALMIKVLPKELSEKMNDCIHIVIFVKARALNSRIFRCYAQEWDQNINHCLFEGRCIGFHGAKVQQDSSSSNIK